jgi:hypothetical protein
MAEGTEGTVAQATGSSIASEAVAAGDTRSSPATTQASSDAVSTSKPAAAESPKGTDQQGSKEPSEAKDSSESPSESPWDKPENPYYSEVKKLRDQYAGLQGNFKQERERLRALEEESRRAREAQAETQARMQREGLRQMLRGDPEKLRQDLAKQLEEQERAEALRRQYAQQFLPKVQEQAFQAVHSEYEKGLYGAAEKHGLERKDVESLAKEAGEFSTFVDRVISQMGEKRAEKTMKEQLPSLVKAVREQVLAELRTNEPSPDTSPAKPSGSYRSVDDLNVAYVNGELGDGRTAANRYAELMRSQFGREP